MAGQWLLKHSFIVIFAIIIFSTTNAYSFRPLKLIESPILRSIGRTLAIIGCIHGNFVHPNHIQAKVNDDISINRLKSSLSELERLDRDWAKYQSNGDDIRRVLGTVYSPPSCNSPLCSSEAFIQKFIRSNMDELDFEAFDGPSSKYLRALNQADFLAYSSIFAGYGNGGSGVDYIDESHKQVKKAILQLKDMITIVTQE